MRLLFLSLFLTLTLIAQKDESCNTVQLLSSYNSSENRALINKQEFPDMCEVMEIGNNITVRCGCFDNFEDTNSLLLELQERYKDSYTTSTYKNRFKNIKIGSTIEERVDTIVIPKKVIIRKKIVKVKIKKKVEKVAKVEIEAKVIQNNLSIGKEKELKIIVQTFMYNSELEYAYKAAQIAYKSNPNSYYWNQKMAEITQWSGRGNESMKYLRFMYFKTHNKKLEKKIIDYGFAAYQYESIKEVILYKARNNPTLANIEKLVLVYDLIGIPRESAEILMQEYNKDKSNHIYLTKALEIYINIGEMENAQIIADEMKNTNKYTLEDAKLLSYFFYLKRDMQAAYNILLLDLKGEKDFKFYQLVSDLGWYLQKYENAAYASLQIIEGNYKKLPATPLNDLHKREARLVDFERVIQVNKDQDNNIALRMSLLSYQKYGSSYLFYSYSLYALRDKKYDALQIVIDEIDASDSNIKNDSEYWVIKATLYSHSGDVESVRYALAKALKINPDSLQTQLTALTLYIDNGINDELRILLQKLEENPGVSDSLSYVLASAYFNIYDVNKASYYIDKLIQVKDPITQTMDFKFFQADIYSVKNNVNGFMTKMYELKDSLDKEALKSPKLMKDDRFLNNYLKISLYVMHSDDFLKKFLISKPYLSEFNYNNLSYAFASINQSTEEAHSIYLKIRRKEPWLKLANAMQQQERSNLADLLEYSLRLLPLNDVSSVANDDGQIALSQSMAFEALKLNSDDQNAYIQHLDLSSKRTDTLSAKIASLIRDPITQRYIDLDNSLYLNNSLYLLNGLKYSSNTLDSALDIVRIPDTSVEVNIGLKKVFRRGEIEGSIAYISSMDKYYNALLKGSFQMNKFVRLSSEIAKNIHALETTELLLSGKKDMFSLGLAWNLMPSISLDFLYENNKYTGDDDVFIGKGDYMRVTFGYQIRNAYPDMRLSAFYDKGIYTEEIGFRGIIDSLQLDRNPVLPKDFYNAGLSFSYGAVNSSNYTRVWRPYFDINGYYNSDLGEFNYGINFGYGGKALSQDHMTVGMSYSESLYGNGGKVFEVFLRYQFFYVHPSLF